MRLLVVYDVSDPRLRRRLARLLGGYGERVQRSAFECVLRPGEHAALAGRLRALVPGDAPAGAEPSLPACSVRLYRLPDEGRVTEIGTGRTVLAPPEVTIV